MKKLCIVHFLPIEGYPPAINYISFAATQAGNEYDIHVITTQSGKENHVADIQGVTIHRIVQWKQLMSRTARMALYIKFNLSCAKLLIKERPGVVMYYETLSAGGAWLYKKIFNRHSHLFIHYHEYTSQQEYRQGMVLSRLLHKLEMSLYHLADWISHTNAKRLELFLKDINKTTLTNVFELPNYPPVSWQKQAHKVSRAQDSRIGFVYVGALSLETMYTREMARFISAHPDQYYWDIYSDNHDNDVIAFLQSLNAHNIQFKGAVKYSDLPTILPVYDVGVILYKGVILNYVYNAPNKFFEYFVCGLNIWYPKEMLGMTPYDQSRGKPFVRMVDFMELQFTDSSLWTKSVALAQQPYYAERVYIQLWDKMQLCFQE